MDESSAAPPARFPSPRFLFGVLAAISVAGLALGVALPGVVSALAAVVVALATTGVLGLFAGTWLVLGPGRATPRTLATFCLSGSLLAAQVAVALAILSFRESPATADQIADAALEVALTFGFSLVGAGVVGVAIAVVLAARGNEWTRATPESDTPPRLSIARLLVATALLAATFALFRRFEAEAVAFREAWNQAGFGRDFWFFVFWTMGVAVSIGLAFFAGTTHLHWDRLAVSLAVAGFLGWSIWRVAANETDADGFLAMLAAAMPAATLLTTAVLALLRRNGWRIDRPKRPAGVPVAAASNAVESPSTPKSAPDSAS